MSQPTDDAVLLAEIRRRHRKRLGGVWLCFGAALLFYAGVHYSLRMMHGAYLPMTPVAGTVVSVETDPRTGETLMTSEFADASGTLHRDRQTAGYHYARGEPEVGERIDYLYGTRAVGGFHAFPRADGLLRWLFGVPAAGFALLGAVLAWVISRERRLRRHLVRHGRRETAQAASIRTRTVVLPGASGGAVAVPMWRLEARYFEPARSAFVECRSDWQAPPIPELPRDAELAPILVDPAQAGRSWLPVGRLVAGA